MNRVDAVFWVDPQDHARFLNDKEAEDFLQRLGANIGTAAPEFEVMVSFSSDSLSETKMKYNRIANFLKDRGYDCSTGYSATLVAEGSINQKDISKTQQLFTALLGAAAEITKQQPRELGIHIFPKEKAVHEKCFWFGSGEEVTELRQAVLDGEGGEKPTFYVSIRPSQRLLPLFEEKLRATVRGSESYKGL